MSCLNLALSPSAPRRLKVVASVRGGALEVLYDGRRIGCLRNARELRRGRTFALPDGTLLTVQRRSLLGGIRLLRNGAVVPGSPMTCGG
jgi:hypothetical protein